MALPLLNRRNEEMENRQTKQVISNLMRLARTYNKQFCKVLHDYTKLEEDDLGITELEEYYKSEMSNIKEI